MQTFPILENSFQRKLFSVIYVQIFELYGSKILPDIQRFTYFQHIFQNSTIMY